MSDLDDAVLTKLRINAGVQTTVLGGVFWDVAPLGTPEPFGIVSLEDSEDTYAMGEAPEDGHIEVARYWVRAIGKGEGNTAVKAAYYAMHNALQMAQISASGFSPMLSKREGRRRYVEPDGAIMWQHNGGVYVIWQAQL